ncbi:MAG: dihydrofolate reductase [Methanoregulaceae archaeon]|nr:MAG: dihydrofolate reductase [Methanoregulaceae archaeon]
MGSIIVYIAASLDGYIARPDDDISWLDPFSAGDEDYGYAGFMKTIGTVIMGSRTWEQNLLHPERHLSGVKNYVLAREPIARVPGIEAEAWHGSPASLAERIRKESDKDIYLAGGGQVISRFLSEGLVDEIRLFIVPFLLGEGIPLFTGIRGNIRLELVNTVPYPGGIAELRYRPVRS